MTHGAVQPTTARQVRRSRALICGLFVLVATLRGQTVINFDSLPSGPARTTFLSFSSSNNGSSTFAGVTFDSRFYVVGDQYVEQFQNNGGSNPFIQPVTVHYGVFNDSGLDALTLTTPLVLTGVWFARPDFGNGVGGASAVMIKALNGATVLGSVSMNLNTGATMQFMDTSAFSSLSGITNYEIDRTATGLGPYGGGHFVADNFTFAAIPEPSAWAALGGVAALGWALRRRGGRRAN
jgi:hypothetical protein